MRTAFNTCVADIPEDIMRTAKIVERERLIRPLSGQPVPEFHIALAILNERERLGASVRDLADALLANSTRFPNKAAYEAHVISQGCTIVGA